ncbi:unnamed protein product [Camellia sinensis]
MSTTHSLLLLHHHFFLSPRFPNSLSFLRRRTIWFGSIVSLSTGAAKEVADELGFFKSAGASARDAVADLLGILLAVLVLSLTKSLSLRIKPDQSGQIRGVEIV